MILENIDTEAILFTFTPSTSGRPFTNFSSLVMKYNFRDIFHSIKVSDGGYLTGIPYLVNDEESGKKIIFINSDEFFISACSIYSFLNENKIKSITMPIVQHDYFEDSKEFIALDKEMLENIKKVLTTLAENDKIDLEVKIVEVDKPKHEEED